MFKRKKSKTCPTDFPDVKYLPLPVDMIRLKTSRMNTLKTILIFSFIILSTYVHAQKEKVVKDRWHAQIWLNDGTTDRGYMQELGRNVYDEYMYLSDLGSNRFFVKKRKYNTRNIDSMYVWIDTNPNQVIVAHSVPVNYAYGNSTPVVYGYPSMCFVIYTGRKVAIYQAWDRFFGDFFLYKTPKMTYAKALFRCDTKLSEKRRKTLCDEFKDYPTIQNYVRTIHKSKVKDDPFSFFKIIDETL